MPENNLGNILRTARYNSGMTQSEAADLLNISNNALSSYERNVSFPSIGKLKKICDLYGLDEKQLLEMRTSAKGGPKINRSANKNSFGLLLANARFALGYTQKEAAEKIGVSLVTLNHWETGLNLSSPHCFDKIAEVYQLDVDSIKDAWIKTKKEGIVGQVNSEARKARVAAGLSQKAAAEIIGIHLHRLAEYEKGADPIPENILRIMADIYNEEKLRPKSDGNAKCFGEDEAQHALRQVRSTYPFCLMIDIFRNENAFILYDYREVLDQISKLSTREQTILLKRYKYKMTLEAIGQELDLTRERIRQLEKHAVDTLREHIFIQDQDASIPLGEKEANELNRKLKRENNRLRSSLERITAHVSRINDTLELARDPQEREI